MSRIVYAWELGTGYGHLSSFLPVALKLRERGHEVVFLLKDLSQAELFLGKTGFAFLQAPIHWPVRVDRPAAVSYPEILINCGFAQKNALLSRTRAWRRLYELLQAELLILDHAPTALLAARDSGIPRALFGTGFSSPPRIIPLPNMRPWLKIPQQRLVDSEGKALSVINSVLEELEISPLKAMAELFDVEEDILCTFPELDHYADRAPTRYWGPCFNIDESMDAIWPPGEGKRIFAYLSSDYPNLEYVLKQLRVISASFRTLVHIRGWSQSLAARHQTPNLVFSPHLVNLTRVGRQSDVAITHANHGTTAAMLLAGCPLLMLPMHLEHLLVARNVARIPAGIFFYPENKHPNIKGTIKQIISDPDCKDGARRFAQKHRDFDAQRRDEKLVECCEEMIANSNHLKVRQKTLRAS